MEKERDMLQVALSWPWITALISFFAIAYLIQSWMKKRNHNHSKRILPPGPKSLPILGHLHLLGKKPHQYLHNLAKNYGPIMFIRLGFVPNIVISSPEAAEQFLKTHDLIFASRPPVEALKYMAYEQRNVSFSPYGAYWRTMRKLLTVELLSNVKIASFESIRKQELSLLIEFMKEASRDRVPVDLSAKVSSMSADMNCRMVLGKKYMDKEFNERGFKSVIQESVLLVATPNIGDYFPCVGALDLQGLNRRCKGLSKIFDRFLEKIIDEHIQSRDHDNKTHDFVDVMLEFMESKEAEFRIDRNNIKAIILDILIASIDTSATTIEWVISELLTHPKAMKKARNELEDVVGMSRMVEESDLEKLEYLYMVIKESFRLHPATPLLLPHEAMQDCVVSGYHIPRKARVIINVCAIGKDPNVWKNPEEFIPERFIGSTIDVKGRDFQLIPFGAGRRSCPGMQLGLLTVRLVVAQLLHCFDWELPEGMMPGDLDMSEEFGLVTSRAKHLHAIPTYRLNK